MPTIRSRTGTALVGVALAGTVVIAPAADAVTPAGGAATPATGARTTKTITMTSSNMFMPMKVTITRGTVVTWKNSSFSSHNVTADSGAWASGTIAPGHTFSRTFKRAGTVHYHCTIHPGMTAVIIVR